MHDAKGHNRTCELNCTPSWFRAILASEKSNALSTAADDSLPFEALEANRPSTLSRLKTIQSASQTIHSRLSLQLRLCPKLLARFISCCSDLLL
eukprot:539998-Pleurochrysis_carterae.AAC.2